MERFEHLLIRVVPFAGGHGKQYVIEPRQWDLQANLDNASDSGTVALLDELGGQGWQLVAVRDDEFWLRRSSQPQDERTVY